jgi:hypothetical protein
MKDHTAAGLAHELTGQLIAIGKDNDISAWRRGSRSLCVHRHGEGKAKSGQQDRQSAQHASQKAATDSSELRHL